MKGELIRLGWPLERVHDLLVLHDRLAARGSDLLVELKPLVTALAEAYFIDRYPGFDLDDPDWTTLRTQLTAIAALSEKIRLRISPSGP